ncbi:MAG: hypothetical protein R3327_02630 [Nitrosopumilaceae archaeon]|nr:hypothetical protein [Nitrosopumilaceae archaeon]
MIISQNSLIFSHLKQIFFLGNILTSFGILLVTVGGSWDITNHLLNKPETFFSPPHALLYTGVAIALIGIVVSFFSWRKLDSKNLYTISVKLSLLGISLLVGAGPFDFVWHSNFGLDGLLSPPHLTLISGMILCSLGAMVGISRYTQNNHSKNKIAIFIIILAILPVWLSATGMISSLSLPFSDTDYFDFNPEPTFAAITATIGYSFLISVLPIVGSLLSNNRFGILSILGGLFLLVYGSTAILPNFALVSSVEFYFVNIIPFLIADFVISYRRSKYSVIFAGGLLGSIFYLIYYPYVMYTFNEVLLGALVSPSMISHIYFQLMPDVFALTIIPSIVTGVIGSLFALKLSKLISVQSS